MKTAKTWGEFIDLLPEGEWNSLREDLDSKQKRKERFSMESIPSFSDGDYPPWLQAEADRCIPAVVLEEFGLRNDSRFNGQFWQFPAEIEQPLLARLRQLGFGVELRDDWSFY